jgi:hypothetical protein
MFFLPRRWLCVPICALFLHQLCHAQIMNKPERLFSEDALFFVDIPKLGESIKSAKHHWHDLIYEKVVRSGRLKPLDLHSAELIRLSLSKESGGPYYSRNRGHWLVSFLNQIRTKDSALVNEAKELSKNLDSANPDFDFPRQDELVTALTALFPGRFIAGIEPKTQQEFAFAFGLEFDPNRFDWFQEMLLVAKDQTKADVKPEFEVGQIKVYYLPVEEFYFFQHNKVLYCVCDDGPDACRAFAQRIAGKPETEKSLLDSKYYRRVLENFDTSIGRDSDVFMFLRFIELQKRRMRGFDTNAGTVSAGAHRKSRQSVSSIDPKKIAKFEQQYSANSVGFSMNFARNGNEVTYNVVYPIIQPSEILHRVSNSLKTMDTKKVRAVLRSAQNTVFVDYKTPIHPTAPAINKHQIGCEISLMEWDNRSSLPKKYAGTAWEDTLAQQIPNPIAFLADYDGSSEATRFTISSIPTTVEYFGDFTQEINDQLLNTLSQEGVYALERVEGYFYPYEQVDGRTALEANFSKALQSPAFKEYANRNRLEITEDGLGQPKYWELEASSNPNNGISGFKAAGLRFAVCELDEGVVLVHDPGFPIGRNSVAKALSNGVKKFQLDECLGGPEHDRGELKVICVNHGCNARLAFVDITAPIRLSLSRFHFSDQVGSIPRYKEALLRNELNSSLFQTYQYLNCEFFSHSAGAQLMHRNLPYTPFPEEQNRLRVYCMFIPKNMSSIRYIGFVRNTKSAGK